MNDRYPLLDSERELINFINALCPKDGELLDRNRKLAKMAMRHRQDIRSARNDRSAQFRRSMTQLGYAKSAALILFSVVAAYLLSQHWSMQSVGFDGWLLLSVSCVFLILIDRYESVIGRWVFTPNLKVKFVPTEAAVYRICRNIRLAERVMEVSPQDRLR
jgi:uncharacterized membrane protein